MTKLFHVVLICSFLGTTTQSFAAETINYGSRAGMEVTIVSTSGLDTANAVMRTEHTRDNAIAFCRDYVQKITEECIQQELVAPLNKVISANCLTGVFIDFGGHKHQFKGKNPAKDAFAPEYFLIDLQTREIADGSMASGYGVNIDVFKALCPTTVASAKIASTKQVATAANTATFKTDYFGCTRAVFLERLEQLAASGDDAAMLEFFRNMAGAKLCTFFSKGESVYIEEGPRQNSTYVRVRKQGSPISVFTRKDLIN